VWYLPDLKDAPDIESTLLSLRAASANKTINIDFSSGYRFNTSDIHALLNSNFYKTIFNNTR
jgi:hypothetical protein